MVWTIINYDLWISKPHPLYNELVIIIRNCAHANLRDILDFLCALGAILGFIMCSGYIYVCYTYGCNIHNIMCHVRVFGHVKGINEDARERERVRKIRSYSFYYENGHCYVTTTN